MMMIPVDGRRDTTADCLQKEPSDGGKSAHVVRQLSFAGAHLAARQPSPTRTDSVKCCYLMIICRKAPPPQMKPTDGTLAILPLFCASGLFKKMFVRARAIKDM